MTKQFLGHMPWPQGEAAPPKGRLSVLNEVTSGCYSVHKCKVIPIIELIFTLKPGEAACSILLKQPSTQLSIRSLGPLWGVMTDIMNAQACHARSQPVSRNRPSQSTVCQPTCIFAFLSLEGNWSKNTVENLERRAKRPKSLRNYSCRFDRAGLRPNFNLCD